jgi:hypothetical protein
LQPMIAPAWVRLSPAVAFDEPNYQAGAYRDVMLRRWRNTLGRTMYADIEVHNWQFGGRQ